MKRFALTLCLLLSPAFAHAQDYATLSAGCVIHCKLDDNAANTTVVDSTGNYSPTLVGGNTTADLSVAGPSAAIPLALQLDGANDYVNASSGVLSDITGSAYTFVSWIKPANITAVHYLAGGRTSGASGWFATFIGTAAGDPIRVTHEGTSGHHVSGASGITANWHHVAVTFAGGSGGAIKYYVDGDEISGATTGNPTALTSAVFYIGNYNNGDTPGPTPLNGAIADFAMDDTEWTQTQIQTFMAGPVSGSAVPAKQQHYSRLRR